MTIEFVWIDMHEVQTIHGRLLALHGGAAGVRDLGGLEAALARPKQITAYAETADLADLAASYTAGVVQNHPFIDGNKRTGFVLGVLFLELHGLTFTAEEADATNVVLSLAAGQIDRDDYAAFLRRNMQPV